ncbi:MAG: bifunctional phosphoribosylaminoimidazolecarboxamide formyltransferase/IMP cyclohydrolase [Rhodospirillaceae bacterium]|nr:bifunctional phosphoribosylaminoimidazolecarboxamide formyltransferase/IMP cyclohydrolase [Rhodospirillaceae bacterium]
MSEHLMPVRRALVSVSDKDGVVDLAAYLADRGVEILSTGGTARALEEADIPVKEVSSHTGFPEIMDGRVKTLHPKIHGGLLARRDSEEHLEALTDYGIAPIDLLVSNLYPFEETVRRSADAAAAIENIDIGGVAMIRAAAKNHEFVAVVTDPSDYPALLAELADFDGNTTGRLRARLAAAAFARTAAYDAAIAQWFCGHVGEPFPRHYTLGGQLAQSLRYGENPHQEAALYTAAPHRAGAATARQVQGKELSYNNLNDTDAAFELVAELDADRPATVIVKHANPCGAAHGATLVESYLKALAGDPVSAFGGIVAVNRRLDAATAHAVAELFLEVVIAPGIDEDAAAILSAKKNLRLLDAGSLPDPAARGHTIRALAGGFLVQDRDNGHVGAADFKVVTERAPTEAELADLDFAWRVVKHVKSNAIVYAKGQTLVGVGAGQMSRVDSARIAAEKADEMGRRENEAPGSRTKGSVVASDAFFPFADGLEAAIAAGATAVVQPGGSMRDGEVIEAANRAGVAMVFTGMRHFRH